ncbi:MAG: hypothetical protein ACPG7F_06660 [Aggregatilineales bacterium]
MSSKKIMPPPLNIDDERTLPLITAEKWDFPLQYHETDEGLMYAVQDWVAGLATTNKRKAAKMWNFMQRKLEMSSSTRHLKYTANDEKQYNVAFTDDEGLYQIAAYMRATKSRPALRAIKDFLAKAGVFADEARRNPEEAEITLVSKRRKKYIKQAKTPEWIATRELGIITRKQLIALVYHLLGTGEHIPAITNDTYQGVFGMTAKELRAHIGIPPTAILRDYFSSMALIYTKAAEEAARIHLENYDDEDVILPEDIRSVVTLLSRLMGKQAREVSKILGVDVVTGKPLLASVNRKDFMIELQKLTENHDM